MNLNFSDFSSHAFYASPYPMYEKVRAAGPLVEMAPNLFVTGHFDIVDALLRDRRMGKAYLQSVSGRYGEAATQHPLFQTLSRTFLMMNPPSHTRSRALLMKSFNARQIEKMRETLEETSRSLLDRIGSKPVFDVVNEYAFPFPIEIICRLLNIPSADGRELGASANRLASSLDMAPMDDVTLAATNEAAIVLEAYFREVVEQRRTAPADDIISLLINVEEDGYRLTDEEIVSNVILMFLAGHETTSNMIGNALIALFRHPAQLGALKRDPALIQKAIAECMRYDNSVQMVARTAFEDIVIHDVTLRRGAVVYLLIGAANRDPAAFSQPDDLIFDRAHSVSSMAFGGGIHYCLGARLALLELEVAIGSLLARFPDMHPEDLNHLTWCPRNNLRGVQSLRMVTSAASGSTTR